MSTSRISHWIWVPVLAAMLGFGAGVYPLWLPAAKQFLLFIGNARLASIDGSLPAESNKSEYLVVLHGESRDDALAYVGQNTHMDYVSDSIYPNALVVALDVPVTEHREALSAQPFARMVLPVLPIFFCH